MEKDLQGYLASRLPYSATPAYNFQDDSETYTSSCSGHKDTHIFNLLLRIQNPQYRLAMKMEITL